MLRCSYFLKYLQQQKNLDGSVNKSKGTEHHTRLQLPMHRVSRLNSSDNRTLTMSLTQSRGFVLRKK